jgi:hypothetical protein
MFNEPLSQKLRQNVKKYVKIVITWSQVADHYMELCKTVMDTPKIESRVILVE